jgi:hypothetical protein
MWNPQVKFKGGIVRVNLDSGMSQSGLGLNTWFQAHGIGSMVLYARECM